MSKPPHMVAIIDDDPRMLSAAANLLSAFGLRRQLYVSIEAFLADPQASQVGCLIVDLELVGAGNFDLARRLAESGRRPGIIFTAENSRVLDFRQVMQGRCLGLVRKPFSASKLVNALTRWLRLDREHRLSHSASSPAKANDSSNPVAGNGEMPRLAGYHGAASLVRSTGLRACAS